MLNKPLTTGEVARLCHVSAVAIWKWIKKGKGLSATQILKQ